MPSDWDQEIDRPSKAIGVAIVASIVLFWAMVIGLALVLA